MTTTDRHGIHWRKSSRSSMQGNCVEVAFTDGHVRARDSKDPSGGQLVFSALTWSSFVSDVRADRFGQDPGST